MIYTPNLIFDDILSQSNILHDVIDNPIPKNEHIRSNVFNSVSFIIINIVIAEGFEPSTVSLEG